MNMDTVKAKCVFCGSTEIAVEQTVVSRWEKTEVDRNGVLYWGSLSATPTNREVCCAGCGDCSCAPVRTMRR